MLVSIVVSVLSIVGGTSGSSNNLATGTLGSLEQDISRGGPDLVLEPDQEIQESAPRSPLRISLVNLLGFGNMLISAPTMLRQAFDIMGQRLRARLGALEQTRNELAHMLRAETETLTRTGDGDDAELGGGEGQGRGVSVLQRTRYWAWMATKTVALVVVVLYLGQLFRRSIGKHSTGIEKYPDSL